MVGEPVRVLFVDHESRLSGGQKDLVDLVGALPPNVEVHAALPEGGPLSDSLAALGASIHLIGMSAGLRKISRWELGSDPLRIFRLPISIWRTSRSLGKLMEEIAPHVVHTNSMKSHVLALAPSRTRDIPLVWHVRDVLNQGWLRRLFAWVGSHGPLRIVCISRCVQEQFIGSPALERSLVIYNGIDLDGFSRRTGKDWRRRFVPRGGLAVGLVGQIARWKGQDLFIEAAASLAQEYPQAKFFIVGECLFPENEGDYEKSLHASVEELGLQDRIEFLGWSDEPYEVMKALDVVVHASRLPEPFGRVIVEGMAAGKPVIASDKGAGPEIVRPGEGLLFDPNEPNALSDALGSLLSGASLRSQMGIKAASGAWRFGIHRTAEEVMQLYSDLGLTHREMVAL
ncbi:MAG TPA: glycosyltransferase family 4 protein [Actinomycetota bacterium]|nr:glycosyltransferase family 4 protein [Actinomycetota bacterium]